MRLHSDTFQQKKTILEAECRELLETRYQRAMEAVKYELLVKRNDRLRDVSPVRTIKCRLCGCRSRNRFLVTSQCCVSFGCGHICGRCCRDLHLQSPNHMTSTTTSLLPCVGSLRGRETCRRRRRSSIEIFARAMRDVHIRTLHLLLLKATLPVTLLQ